MKNIKTSKIVALVLSLAMIVNVFAGLSLTSFAADVTVGMYFMDQNNGYSTPSEFVAGQSYTAVVNLANYNATNAAAYPISGLQIDVAVDSQITTGFVDAKEESGYSFDGTKNFASATTDDNGNAIVRFASIYGAPGTDGGFEYSALAASEGTIEIMAFVFTVAENATGTVSFPMTVVATDASLAPYEFVVNNRTIAVGAANTTEKLSLYGPDLKAINEGKYIIDDATSADGTGYTPFGTSWTAAGFKEGSSLVRMGYNNFVYLGSYDFSNVTKIEITYHTDGTFVAEDSANPGTYATLGLSKVQQSFGWVGGEAAHFNNAIAYGALSNGTPNGWPEARTVTITEGIDNTYNGDVWLTTYSCNGQIIVATDVTLYRSAETTDPTPDEPTPDEPTPDEPTTVTFKFNTDFMYTDGNKVDVTGIGATSKFIWANYGHLPTLSVTDNFNFTGWLSTENGVSLYEYSVNGGDWTALGAESIFARGELADLGYVGSETAGFNITIPASALVADSSNTVDLRFTDGNGNTAEFVQFTIYAGTIVEKYTAYQSNIDFYFADGVSTQMTAVGATGANTVIPDTITISQHVRFAGWCVTTNGTAGYEYSLDGITWNAITECTLTSIPEVADTPYGAGYETGRFDFTIPATAFVEGTNTLYIRGIDKSDNAFDLLSATVVYVPAVVTPTTYTVSVGAVSNGTVAITPSGTVEEGTTITVTATPSADYKLVAILVNGTAIEGNTFTVTADAVVTAAFNKIQYTVSVGEVSNGTVTLDPTGTVDVGTTVTVTATPAEGYELESILVNGTAIEGTTFTVTADSVVTATFKKVQHTVSVGTVANGTVTLSATGAVDYGTTVTVTATAAEGYELESILVNGTAIEGTTFTVTADSVVTATFTETVVEAETYTITVVTGGKGTGTVTVVETAKAGETITLTAARGKNAADLTCVCTVISSTDATLTTTKNATGDYSGATFTMPAANVTITVNFQILGDVNLNGGINALDASQLSLNLAGKKALTEEQMIVANLTGSSNATINGMDGSQLRLYCAGKRTSFGNS